MATAKKTKATTVVTTQKRAPRKQAADKEDVYVEKEQGFFGSITDFDNDTHITMEMRVSSTAKKVVVGAALIGAGVVIAKCL